MVESELSALEFLWDGSAPEWCLRITHRHERRIVVTFDRPGPTVSDVVRMREVFEELQSRSAQAIWTEVRGELRVVLRQVYSPVDAPGVAERAWAQGLRVEVIGADTVSYLPFNRKTEAALVIESDELLASVAERMLVAGAPSEHIEVD